MRKVALWAGLPAVAAAVGEGSTVVAAIHAWLARRRETGDARAAAE